MRLLHMSLPGAAVAVILQSGAQDVLYFNLLYIQYVTVDSWTFSLRIKVRLLDILSRLWKEITFFFFVCLYRISVGLAMQVQFKYFADQKLQ